MVPPSCGQGCGAPRSRNRNKNIASQPSAKNAPRTATMASVPRGCDSSIGNAPKHITRSSTACSHMASRVPDVLTEIVPEGCSSSPTLAINSGSSRTCLCTSGKRTLSRRGRLHDDYRRTRQSGEAAPNGKGSSAAERACSRQYRVADNLHVWRLVFMACLLAAHQVGAQVHLVAAGRKS